jgi:hypothetical protein
MVAFAVTESIPAVVLAVSLRPGPDAAALLSGGGAPGAGSALRAAAAAALLAPLDAPLSLRDAVFIAALRVSGGGTTLFAATDALNVEGNAAGATLEDLVSAAAPGGLVLVNETGAQRRTRRALQGGAGASRGVTLALVAAAGDDAEVVAAADDGAAVLVLNLLVDSSERAAAVAAGAAGAEAGGVLAVSAAAALAAAAVAAGEGAPPPFSATLLPGTLAPARLLLRRTRWAEALDWLRMHIARVVGVAGALLLVALGGGTALAARRRAREEAAVRAPLRAAAAVAAAARRRRVLRERLGLLRYAKRAHAEARGGDGAFAEEEEDLWGDPHAGEFTPPHAPSPPLPTAALPAHAPLLHRPTPRARDDALTRLAQYKQQRRAGAGGAQGAGAARPTSV